MAQPVCCVQHAKLLHTTPKSAAVIITDMQAQSNQKTTVTISLPTVSSNVSHHWNTILATSPDASIQGTPVSTWH